MLSEITDWDGRPISEPGLYRGIPIETYHHDATLLPGPSASKSSIKHIAPPNGSPKAFFRTWAGNPDRVIDPPSKALIFGKAVHALLLGDEVFEEKFIIRPEKVSGYVYNGNRKEWRDWYAEQEKAGLLVVTVEDIEQIRAMAEDAAKHPLVISGGLNGEVEISMFAKCPRTKIWLKSRPDVFVTDGIFNDLKSVAKIQERFIQKQFEEAGYYLQAAMTKMVCDLLGVPFRAFGFLYCLSEGGADTEYRIADDEDIAIGEAVVNYGLDKIREGINSGEWQGISVYGAENFPLKMDSWAKTRITTTLQREGYWK